MNNRDESLIIGKDIPWENIEKDDLRVKDFTPFALVEQGKIKSPSTLLPYASLLVESPILPNEATLPVVHKVDFRNLWEVFKERGVKPEEEVVVFYAPSRGILSTLKPKLHIYIYPKGHQEKIHNPKFESGLDTKTWRKWIKPIAEWHPK